MYKRNSVQAAHICLGADVDRAKATDGRVHLPLGEAAGTVRLFLAGNDRGWWRIDRVTLDEHGPSKLSQLELVARAPGNCCDNFSASFRVWHRSL